MDLAKLLVREGLVSVEQIRESIEYCEGSGTGLGESLAALGYVTEPQLVEFLSRHYGVPSMDIDVCETDESVLRLIPRETALEKFLVPISVEGPDLTIAVSDPSNILMLDDLGFITGKNIKPVVASERSIRTKLTEYYGESGAAQAQADEEGSGESGPRDGTNTAFMFSDERSRPADDVVRELGQFSKDRMSVDNEPDAEETHSGTGIDIWDSNGGGSESGTFDENIERDKETKEDFVFDFTDGNVRRDEIPSAESGGGPDLNETDIDTSHEMSVSAPQDSDPGPEDPAPQDGNGILIHGAAEDADDNELGAASATGRDTEPGAYDTDTQSNESHEEKADETVSSEQITGTAFETPHELDSPANGDGYAPSEEETSGTAPVINGPVSPGRDEKMHEERGSVLIVDFSPTVRKIMRISLERAGYKVVSAGDGMQALASINESIPDLIFVDLKLPHMDGYQLCKVIKSHGLTKEVPVVMLSGKVGVLDKMKIKMAGASDVITKPFGSDALVGAAEKYAK
jgi:CheY-like chemotaxis protein